MYFKKAKPCPTKPRMCARDATPYCLLMPDGTLKDHRTSIKCPPCGENVAYLLGFCDQWRAYELKNPL